MTSDAQMRSTDTIPEPIDDRYHIRTAVQTRYLPEIQARARSLDTAQIVEMVRRG